MRIVHRLASALDADDYDTAERLLEPDAVYDSGDSVVHGSAAIIESFSKTSDWGRTNLDELVFTHVIDDDRAPFDIVFVDVLRSGGEELALRHNMHVGISKRGLVKTLRLDRPAGEKENRWRLFRKARTHQPPENQPDGSTSRLTLICFTSV